MAISRVQRQNYGVWMWNISSLDHTNTHAASIKVFFPSIEGVAINSYLRAAESF